MSFVVPQIPKPCETTRLQASNRQMQLTKPPGSLGRLEALAIHLAALQARPKPSADKAWVSVFAADHGIAEEGVSAYPQAVTRLMLANFIQGGAAISVLAKRWGANLEVVDVGVAEALADCPGLVLSRAGAGTANFMRQAAMQPHQLRQALIAGAEAAQRAKAWGADLFIGGEMGIANTSAATALASALLNVPPKALAGPGTGLDDAGVRHKAHIIAQALAFHADNLTEPLEILRCLGGFEIAALVAAYLHSASLRIPVLVDGFICTVAALLAVRLQADLADWLLFSHRSAEPGHGKLLDALAAQPILDLSMRLGEGSGAVAALPLLQAACALHNGMATFAEAGIPSR